MKKLILSFLSVLLVLFFVSCGSKETPEQTTEPEAPVVTETTEEIKEVVEEIEVIDNSVSLKAMDAARNSALESGAEEFAPEQLKALDSLYETIKTKAEKGEDIAAESADLSKKYQALASYIKAKATKEKIEKTNKFSLAQSLYDEGCKALEKYETLINDPNASAQDLFDNASAASISLNSALVIVYKQLAKDARTEAIASKKKADSVKAAVAQKETYKEAVDLMKKADSLYAMQSIDKAYDNYIASNEIFAKLYEDIYEKRQAALAAIEEAKKRVAESANFAEQADLEAPLTEKVEGIEDEDTVLLEADNYEDPAKAEAVISEELEEKSLLEQVEGTANNLQERIDDALNAGDLK